MGQSRRSRHWDCTDLVFVECDAASGGQVYPAALAVEIDEHDQLGFAVGAGAGDGDGAGADAVVMGEAGKASVVGDEGGEECVAGIWSGVGGEEDEFAFAEGAFGDEGEVGGVLLLEGADDLGLAISRAGGEAPAAEGGGLAEGGPAGLGGLCAGGAGEGVGEDGLDAGEFFEFAEGVIGVGGVVVVAVAGEGADDPDAAGLDEGAGAGQEVGIDAWKDGGEEEFEAVEWGGFVAELAVEAGIQQEAVPALQGRVVFDGVLFVVAEGLGADHAAGAVGPSDGDLGADGAGGEQLGAEFVEGAVDGADTFGADGGGAPGVEDGGVGELAVGAHLPPEPVVDALGAQGEAGHGFGVEEAGGVGGVVGGGPAVVGDGGFHEPEGLAGFGGAEEVAVEDDAAEVGGGGVGVEAGEIEVLVESAVVDGEHAVGVVGDGGGGVAADDAGLGVGEIGNAVLGELLPGGEERGVVQEGGGLGGGDLIKGLVVGGPAVGSPFVVEGGDGGEFLLQPGVPELDGVFVEVLIDVALELVVDLPGEEGGVMAEGLGLGFDDAHAGGEDGGVVVASVLARAVGHGGAVGGGEAAVGVAVGEPDRRASGGGADDGGDAGGGELVHDADKEVEGDLTFMGLHGGPGEIAEADDVDADVPHFCDFVVDGVLWPEFWVVAGTVPELGGVIEMIGLVGHGDSWGMRCFAG